jgi:hypothetical protein
MTPSSLIFMPLAILMFVFGAWGRRHAGKLATQETDPTRRERKQKSIRNGGVAWQIVAAACFVMSLADTIIHH